MKYPEDFINKIINGDCLEVMKKFSNESISAIISDPPYGINYKKIQGDESIDTYINSAQEMFRVLKKDSFCVLYCFPKYIPIVISKFEKIGFEYLWIGFNYYPNMFKQKPQPLGYNRYDLFLIFGKGNPKKRGYIKDTIHILMDKNNYKDREFGHPHQKPEKGWEKLLKATTKENDIILDPFCGTAGLCAVAKKMNRNYIGIEIDKKWAKIAIERLKITRG